MIDPITDLMNRVRNAALARHDSTRAPFSKMKEKIVQIMENEGYIDGFNVDEKDGIHRELVIHLRYIEGSRTAINKMRRVSKPGRRVFCSAKSIPSVKSGLGVSVVSTSKGIITDRDARKMNVGGEVLCEIW
jgi:small subunit ribosomal protein S8